MSYVIVDLECTCWNRNDPNYGEHETIEIGAVFLDENYKKMGQFDCFVKPNDNPTLSEYCTELTGITQKQIDEEGIPFPKAMEKLSTLLPKDPPVFCSWGNFDENQLRKECEDCEIAYPFEGCEHINIKAEFMKKLERKKVGLQKACRVFGLRFIGVPHRGIDDANMIAEVFEKLRTMKKP